ncbi:UNVERIFIED_CONTAM: hypothetical protein PYX00_005784 [Menopon gallinae]|uniref:Glycolipid transfer protein domain-containing protein n=1 Tax=Menopon gallinae TaxID=328185 RepID=A0AAW2HUL6_9NEOP
MAELTGFDSDVKTDFLLGHFFPELCDDKINTLKFLQASRGVVALIDKFGKVFSPLSYDISGNINKLQKSYETNPKKYTFIEDLILCDRNENGVAVDALLWLQRALHFLLLFFMEIVKDMDKSESLQKHMTSAYSQALEPYHGWITRNLFRCFRSMVPKRSVLLSAISEDKDSEEVIKDLEVYVKNLETNVNHIIMFYKESDLSMESKVP